MQDIYKQVGKKKEVLVDVILNGGVLPEEYAQGGLQMEEGDMVGGPARGGRRRRR